MAEDNNLAAMEDCIPDITLENISTVMATPNPANGKAFFEGKKNISARLGVWRTGARYRTDTLLRFRADHAAAMDAVFSDVSEKYLQENNLPSISTVCQSKNEFLTRPDLGCIFSDESIEMIKKMCPQKPKVLVYASDGLSSTAIEANFMDTYLSLKQGLLLEGLDCPPPFFVKYGRVRAMDVISRAVDADVVIVLIGERPGLVTSESMSAYISYRSFPGIKEIYRLVISNIHCSGTKAVEAGAHIAHIAKCWLEQKKESGNDLKL